MSANSENPRKEESSSQKSSDEGGDFESGLDYGAYAGDEPDFPEDHLAKEEQAAPSDAAPKFSSALNGGDEDVAAAKAAPADEGAGSEDATKPVASAPAPKPAEEAVPAEDQPTAAVAPVPADDKTRALNDVAPGTAAGRSTTPAETAAQTGASPAGAPTAVQEVPAEQELSKKELKQREKDEARRAKEEAKAEKQAAKHARTSGDDETPYMPYAGGTVGRTPSGEEITDQDLAEEVERDKRGVSRFMQVMIAIFLPVLVLVAAIRLVASPVFLWLSYNRPGFPSDTFGFDDADRLVYGSYGLDYLFNAANSRYLAELAPGGEELFTTDEVSHMTDVKFVMMWAVLAAAVLLVITLIFGLFLRSWRPGGFVRGLFAGVWVTLGVIIAAVVLAVLNWQVFFEEFHRLFFAEGTWTFTEDSTLIRLYPEQFWIDAGIGVAALVLLISLVLLIATWPTRRRRARRAARMEEVKERRREKLIAELTKGVED